MQPYILRNCGIKAAVIEWQDNIIYPTSITTSRVSLSKKQQRRQRPCREEASYPFTTRWQTRSGPNIPAAAHWRGDILVQTLVTENPSFSDILTTNKFPDIMTTRVFHWGRKKPDRNKPYFWVKIYGYSSAMFLILWDTVLEVRDFFTQLNELNQKVFYVRGHIPKNNEHISGVPINLCPKIRLISVGFFSVSQNYFIY